MNEQQSAEELAQVLLYKGYTEAVEIIHDYLHDDQSRLRTPEWIATQQWYASLDPVGQEHATSLIKAAAKHATVGIAVLFDGAAGYHSLPDGRDADFAVDMRVYAEDDPHHELVVEKVQVVPDGSSEDLHDILLGFFDDIFPVT